MDRLRTGPTCMPLCSLACVVFQEPPEPFTTLNWALTRLVLADRRKEQHVALALMISLVMIMLHVLIEGAIQGRFSKQNQPRQTLFFDRSHPALCVSVQIRRPRRQGHPRDPGRVDNFLKGGAVFPVPVVDEILSG